MQNLAVNGNGITFTMLVKCCTHVLLYLLHKSEKSKLFFFFFWVANMFSL